jgi:hypothetical protein
MSKLQAVLEQQMPPGVYRFPSRAALATFAEEAEAAGWRLFHLDGSAIHDKASFLAASKTALGMPQYVGSNWDAYEEAVNDLAWDAAQGCVLLYDDAAVLDEHDPQALATALDILATASSNWQAEGKPFYTLLRNAGRVDAAVRPWPDSAG